MGNRCEPVPFPDRYPGPRNGVGQIRCMPSHVLGGVEGLRGAPLAEVQLGLLLPLFAEHFRRPRRQLSING